MARPDAAQATARIGAAGTTLPVKLVVIGEDAYLTNLFTGAWERAPDDFGYNPALLFDPARGLGAILPGLEEAELTGEEEIGGRRARRVEGVVDGERIGDITADTVEGERIDVVVWVASDNSDLLRATLAAPSGTSGSGGRPGRGRRRSLGPDLQRPRRGRRDHGPDVTPGPMAGDARGARGTARTRPARCWAPCWRWSSWPPSTWAWSPRSCRR